MGALTNFTGIGVASCDRGTVTGAGPEKAFDNLAETYFAVAGVQPFPVQLQYDLMQDVAINVYSITPNNSTVDHPYSWSFEGSSDGVSFVTLDTRSVESFVPGVARFFAFENTAPFRYYRLNISANNAGTTISIAEMELHFTFGPDVTGAGTASSNRAFNIGREPAMAFDNEATTFWHATTANTFPVTLVYDFGAPTTVRAYTLVAAPPAHNDYPSAWVFAGSNDGNNYVTLDSRSNQRLTGSAQIFTVGITNPSYRYYRLGVLAVSNPGHLKIGEVELLTNITLPPTPTPSPTPTATATPTVTRTPTRTVTPTMTPTRTPQGGVPPPGSDPGSDGGEDPGNPGGAPPTATATATVTASATSTRNVPGDVGSDSAASRSLRDGVADLTVMRKNIPQVISMAENAALSSGAKRMVAADIAVTQDSQESLLQTVEVSGRNQWLWRIGDAIALVARTGPITTKIKKGEQPVLRCAGPTGMVPVVLSQKARSVRLFRDGKAKVLRFAGRLLGAVCGYPVGGPSVLFVLASKTRKSAPMVYRYSLDGVVLETSPPISPRAKNPLLFVLPPTEQGDQLAGFGAKFGKEYQVNILRNDRQWISMPITSLPPKMRVALIRSGVLAPGQAWIAFISRNGQYSVVSLAY